MFSDMQRFATLASPLRKLFSNVPWKNEELNQEERKMSFRKLSPDFDSNRCTDNYANDLAVQIQTGTRGGRA